MVWWYALFTACISGTDGCSCANIFAFLWCLIGIIHSVDAMSLWPFNIILSFFTTTILSSSDLLIVELKAVVVPFHWNGMLFFCYSLIVLGFIMLLSIKLILSGLQLFTWLLLNQQLCRLLLNLLRNWRLCRLLLNLIKWFLVVILASCYSRNNGIVICWWYVLFLLSTISTILFILQNFKSLHGLRYL